MAPNPSRWHGVALALCFPLVTEAFYIPGVAPVSYRSGDTVPLYVNHLTPSESQRDSQVHSVFSFDYYYPSFHFCAPSEGPKYISESLGSILLGDRIQTSPFQLHMTKNETCKALCQETSISATDAKFVNRRIWQNYMINWLIDGLPAAHLQRDLNTNADFLSPGFSLGSVPDDTPYLNNHYDILVDYHQWADDQYRVVGILVEPSSTKNSRLLGDGVVECGSNELPLALSETDTTSVTWTYSVYWRPSDVTFATRWDMLLHVYDPRIHWFSLVNSTIIVVFLVGMVSTVLIRTLKKDIARYNRLDQFGLDDLTGTSVEDGVQEDSGWKLVHGDVFRPPRYSLLLSILLGNGAQVFMMTGFTILFALLGFLSPSHRGSLATVMILLYTLFGFVGGYVSARSYKTFQGDKWKQNFAYTPLALPIIIFGSFFFMNLFVWARRSSGAVPLSTMIVIILIWFIISVPLSLIGSWLGFRHPEPKPPVRTNQIPRQIPVSQGWMRPTPSMLLAGFLPFGAIFVELFFIMNSIWSSRVYYMFGFLFLCYGLMIMTSATVTVLVIYFVLCAEDYRWHWRSFLTAGSSAGYVFAYCLFYWIRSLSFASWTSGVLYLGYSALISLLVFVLTGSIGFLSSYLFIFKIYGSLKVD